MSTRKSKKADVNFSRVVSSMLGAYIVRVKQNYIHNHPDRMMRGERNRGCESKWRTGGDDIVGAGQFQNSGQDYR